MEVKYSKRLNLFYWNGPFESRAIPRKAGFEFSKEYGRWITPNKYIAYSLWEYADDMVKSLLRVLHGNFIESGKIESDYKGNGLYPFQYQGAFTAYVQLVFGRKAVGIFDDQGLGKTIQAIQVANFFGYSRLLVVCPASLRLNWRNELEKWHKCNKGIAPIFTGKDKIPKQGSIVVSYGLAKKVLGINPELIIIDECHYLKNPGTIQTKTVLGKIAGKAPTLFLSGTPAPNGRPNELFPIFKKCAPDVISGMSYINFVNRFCSVFNDPFGGLKITGAKISKELNARLRGSGFMIRRLKSEVLKDLPPKRYKMVVFPAQGEMIKILEKEKQFDVEEIIKHGVPVGTVLPEIRREMGIAKVPQAVGYINDLLESGDDKFIIFAYHREVIRLLNKEFKEAFVITGSTSPKERQRNVDKFQNEGYRLIIGNLQAMGVGVTLTAAHDVIFVENSWLPDNQAEDRAHRIGQTESVLIHQLVVEGSLDAKILGTAIKKQTDIKQILGG